MLALWKPDMKPFRWLLSIDINPRHSESVKVSFHFSSLRHSLLLLLIDKVFRYTRSCVNVIIRTVNRTKKKLVFKLQQGRLTTFFRLRFFIFVCSSFKRNSIKLRVSFLVRIVLLTTNDYAWAKIVFRSLTRTNLVLLNDSSNSLARGSRVRYAWTFQDDLFVLRFKPLWKCQQSVDCIRTVSLIIHSPRSFKSQLAWKKFNETTSMFADSDRVYYCLREFRYLSRHPQTSFLCFLGQPFRFHSTTPVDSSFAIKPRTTRRICDSGECSCHCDFLSRVKALVPFRRWLEKFPYRWNCFCFAPEENRVTLGMQNYSRNFVLLAPLTLNSN